MRAFPAFLVHARIAVVALLMVATVKGQTVWSGDITVTAKGLDRQITENTNFRGDDPFNDVRLRLFPRHWINRRMAFFGEFLYDRGLRGGSIRVNGAYIVINELFGKPWLSLKAGLIPSPFGNYSLRSTYFNLNPLIGIPLMWHHRTPLDKKSFADPESLLQNRSDGQGYQPIGYDACWDVGVELFGATGIVEYSFALTEGTLSNPNERANSGRQIIGRLGINPGSALRIGASVARGPYLEPAAADSLYPVVENYNATAMGGYLEYKIGFLQVYSEIVQSTWESPYLSSDELLTAWSGYAEARYDVSPTLYLAARYDAIAYSTFADPTSGADETWGVPLNRIEAGAGYRLTREVAIKAVYQKYDYDQILDEAGDNLIKKDSQMVALQLHMVF